MGLFLFLVVYLLGGLTFIPGAIWLFVYLHPVKSPSGGGDTKAEGLKAGEIEENLNTGIEAHKAGWITVTHEYLESIAAITSSTPTINDSSSNKSAYSSLYKLVKNADTSSSLNDDKSPTTEKSTDLSNSASITSANDKPKGSTNHKKHRYYAVLKHGNLFLYKNEKLNDVKHVIVLSNHFISLWPKGLTDSQLFTKYTAIAIMRKNWSRARRLSDKLQNPHLDDDLTSEINVSHIMDPNLSMTPPPGSFFIYCDTNSIKEDWYFALIRATKDETQSSSSSSTNGGMVISDPDDILNPNVYAKTLHFETSDMINLIQTLYSSEGQLYTKWLNAIMGRLFLSLQKTETLSNYLKTRIYKKLNKIKTPGFLDKFQITKLEPGHSAPFLTFPELVEINPNGELVVKTLFHYLGSMSIQVSTKVNINLGSRFKNREVDVVLSITLVKLEGPLLIKFKPPPLSRIWYAFEKEPLMTLTIEPVVSSRQLTYNIITNSIEKKFKEAVKESLVVPHWDDFSFYDTSNELFRAGIWDHSPRKLDSNQYNNEAGDMSTEFDVHQSLNKQESAADLAPAKPPPNSKLKLTNTLNDFSKRMKLTFDSDSVRSVGSSDYLNSTEIPPTSPLKSSASTVSPLGFGNNVTKSSSSTSSSDKSFTTKKSMSTLKKIGKWYFKDGGNPESTSSSSPVTETDVSSGYNRPEMILNRRPNRKNSNVSVSHSIEATPPSPPKITTSTHGHAPSYDFGSTMSPAVHMLSGNLQSMNHSPSIQKSFDSDVSSTSSVHEHTTKADQTADTKSVALNEVEEIIPKFDGTSKSELLDEKTDIEDLIQLNDTEVLQNASKLKSGSNSSGLLLHRKPPPTPPELPSRSNTPQNFH